MWTCLSVSSTAETTPNTPVPVWSIRSKHHTWKDYVQWNSRKGSTYIQTWHALLRFQPLWIQCTLPFVLLQPYCVGKPFGVSIMHTKVKNFKRHTRDGHLTQLYSPVRHCAMITTSNSHTGGSEVEYLLEHLTELRDFPQHFQENRDRPISRDHK